MHFCPLAMAPFGPCCGVFSPDYLAEPLTPYPLPTKDGGVLRTIGDARAYMLKLSEVRQWLEALKLLVILATWYAVWVALPA
jgi:hypothetical protein